MGKSARRRWNRVVNESSESVNIVRFSVTGHVSSAKAIAVSSGRVEDAAPNTATLRAGMRSPIETKAEPMLPSNLREPFVATKIVATSVCLSVVSL